MEKSEEKYDFNIKQLPFIIRWGIFIVLIVFIIILVSIILLYPQKFSFIAQIFSVKQ